MCLKVGHGNKGAFRPTAEVKGQDNCHSNRASAVTCSHQESVYQITQLLLFCELDFHDCTLTISHVINNLFTLSPIHTPWEHKQWAILTLVLCVCVSLCVCVGLCVSVQAQEVGSVGCAVMALCVPQAAFLQQCTDTFSHTYPQNKSLASWHCLLFVCVFSLKIACASKLVCYAGVMY